MKAKGAGEGTKAKPWKLKTRAARPRNPVKGWYGLKKGPRGGFGMYLPPLLEALGLALVEHTRRNNGMRAL